MTAEVRLVDADELRRRIEANRSAWDAWSYRNALYLLDSLSTVTAPKGWTRDEVLAELAKHPDNVCEEQDAHTGEWRGRTADWVRRWKDPDVPRLSVRVVRSTPDPEWVPLTKLVGRTIHGETESVCRFEGYSEGVLWFPTEGPARAKDVAFDGEGRVAVRPEAAT